MDAQPEPVACTLTTADAARQVLEWDDLREHVLHSEPIEGGYSLTIDPSMADAVEDLAARESACCAFLDITTERDAEGTQLRVTSDNPDATPVIELLVNGG